MQYLATSGTAGRAFLFVPSGPWRRLRRQLSVNIDDRDIVPSIRPYDLRKNLGDQAARTVDLRFPSVSAEDALRSRRIRDTTIIIPPKKLILDLYRDLMQPLLSSVSPLLMIPNISL